MKDVIIEDIKFVSLEKIKGVPQVKFVDVRVVSPKSVVPEALNSEVEDRVRKLLILANPNLNEEEITVSKVDYSKINLNRKEDLISYRFNF